MNFSPSHLCPAWPFCNCRSCFLAIKGPRHTLDSSSTSFQHCFHKRSKDVQHHEVVTSVTSFASSSGFVVRYAKTIHPAVSRHILGLTSCSSPPAGFFLAYWGTDYCFHKPKTEPLAGLTIVYSIIGTACSVGWYFSFVETSLCLLGSSSCRLPQRDRPPATHAASIFAPPPTLPPYF